MEAETIKSRSEEEIYQGIVQRLFCISNAFTDQQEKVLEEYELTISQYQILNILKQQFPKPVTVNFLIGSMLSKMCDGSRLVEKLRTKGYLERHICPIDRRAANVKLSEAGIEVLNKVQPQLTAWLNNVRQKLTYDQAIELNNLLLKINN